MAESQPAREGLASNAPRLPADLPARPEIGAQAHVKKVKPLADQLLRADEYRDDWVNLTTILLQNPGGLAKPLGVGSHY